MSDLLASLRSQVTGLEIDSEILNQKRREEDAYVSYQETFRRLKRSVSLRGS